MKMDSHSANVVDTEEKRSREGRSSAVEEILEMKDNEVYSQGPTSLADRVRKEVRDHMGEIGGEILDEALDEDDSAEVKILEEEEVIRGTRGVGALWKLSLCAFVSFATYILLSGPHIEPNWMPNFTERDPIPKIHRSRNRKHSPPSS